MRTVDVLFKLFHFLLYFDYFSNVARAQRFLPPLSTRLPLKMPQKQEKKSFNKSVHEMLRSIKKIKNKFFSDKYFLMAPVKKVTVSL